ncbi:MAG TPA: hypothetical protein DCE78_13230 [Bacteroidetes bacterium]|nr:hypothetical protein [Bacteroidota bacterium]
MSTAELNKIKLDLIAWINHLSDENVIEFLDGLKQSESNHDWWDQLTTRQQQIIHEGITDAENDNIISSEEFWKSLKDG